MNVVTSKCVTALPRKLEVSTASFTVILFVIYYSADNRTHKAVNCRIDRSWPRTTKEKKKY